VGLGPGPKTAVGGRRFDTTLADVGLSPAGLFCTLRWLLGRWLGHGPQMLHRYDRGHVLSVLGYNCDLISIARTTHHIGEFLSCGDNCEASGHLCRMYYLIKLYILYFLYEYDT
jgi:hypothetical protein